VHRSHLAVVAAVLTVVCVVPYLRDIRAERTRPQRVSWFVFAALAIVAAVSQTLEGADAGALLAAGAAVGFSAVAIASITRGVGGVDPASRSALAIATVGAIVSVIAAEPIIAIVAVVFAELAAVSLTVRKAFVDPGSETLSTWVVDGTAGVLGVIAIQQLSFVDALYPTHHAIANGVVVVAILLGRRNLARS
jgi:hypothetical protein